jgi:uncharacterized membrane protein YhaH (DUF805 family)
MKWYFRALKKYATFSGRARRREYWAFVFLNSFVGVAFTLLAWIIGLVVGRVELGDGRTASVMAVGSHVGILASIAYMLALLIPSYAVVVRRMHDTGRSGWWILFPVIGFIYLFLDSQPGENEYGPNRPLSNP